MNEGLVILLLWRHKKHAKDVRQSGEALLDRVRVVRDQVIEAAAREAGAIQSISLLEEDVSPLEAYAVLKASLPESTPSDRQALMRSFWGRQRRPQALSALLGLVLEEDAISEEAQTAIFGLVLREGEPWLLDHLAREIGQRGDRFDALLTDGWLLKQMDGAAIRINKSAKIASRLQAAAKALQPRTRQLMIMAMRREIDRLQEEPAVNPSMVVERLAPLCWPRFPELLAVAHGAVDIIGGKSVQEAHLRLDVAVMYAFHDLPTGLAGFDLDAALSRLCSAIMSSDEALSRVAAQMVAGLLQDGYYNSDANYAALQRALDWAVDAHGLTSSHRWLDEQLNPPLVSQEELQTAEEHLLLRAGMSAVEEATATLDPLVALAEMRTILPHAPNDLLRTAAEERYRASRVKIWLTVLGGLGLEAIEMGEAASARHALRLPLLEGTPAQVAALVVLLEDRVDWLDSWIRHESSVNSLRAARDRVGKVVDRLLGMVKKRRVTLLENEIAARLRDEEARDDERYAAQLVLDLYKHCVPGEVSLAGPLRTFLEKRRSKAPWRMALVLLETLVVEHFGEQGALEGYDFAYLRWVMADALADEEVGIADLAAGKAAKLVSAGYLSSADDLAMLQDGLEMARAKGVLPGKFIELDTALNARI